MRSRIAHPAPAWYPALGPDAPPVRLAPHAAPPCSPLVRATIGPSRKVNECNEENSILAVAAQQSANSLTGVGHETTWYGLHFG